MVQMHRAARGSVAQERADEMVLAGSAPSASYAGDPVAHVHRGTSFILLVDLNGGSFFVKVSPRVSYFDLYAVNWRPPHSVLAAPLPLFFLSDPLRPIFHREDDRKRIECSEVGHSHWDANVITGCYLISFDNETDRLNERGSHLREQIIKE